MKTTEKQIKDLVGLVVGSLLADLLGSVTKEKEKTPCSCFGEEDKVETPKVGKVWYVVVDSEGEFDGVIHKTSKVLDIREFKGKTIEVFDNYSEANKRRNHLLDEDLNEDLYD